MRLSREVAEYVLRELDYVAEAQSQREFAALYRDHPFIRVPDVVTELSTSRVLTQELVGGVGWEDALNADEPLRQSWAEAMDRFLYGSMFDFGLFNVDTHPGNYRFHDDGTVSFLDFGCVCRLTPEVLDQLDELTRAAVAGDANRVWKVCLAVGVWDETDPVTPQEALAYFQAGLEHCIGEQPYTLTTEVVARSIRTHLDPTGPAANAMRHIKSPETWGVVNRTNIGMLSMLAELGATNDWRAIYFESRGDGPSASSLGAAHREFLRHHPAALQRA